MATATRHREISNTFLEHAEDEFRKGDMLQASEKAWGAVAHYVKAVARERGWPNRSHDDLRYILSVLVTYTDDPFRAMRAHSAIETLHVNFYEEKFSRGKVRLGMDDARWLLYTLRRAKDRFPKRLPSKKQLDNRERNLFGSGRMGKRRSRRF